MTYFFYIQKLDPARRVNIPDNIEDKIERAREMHDFGPFDISEDLDLDEAEKRIRNYLAKLTEYCFSFTSKQLRERKIPSPKEIRNGDIPLDRLVKIDDLIGEILYPRY